MRHYDHPRLCEPDDFHVLRDGQKTHQNSTISQTKQVPTLCQRIRKAGHNYLYLNEKCHKIMRKVVANGDWKQGDGKAYKCRLERNRIFDPFDPAECRHCKDPTLLLIFLLGDAQQSQANYHYSACLSSHSCIRVIEIVAAGAAGENDVAAEASRKPKVLSTAQNAST